MVSDFAKRVTHWTFKGIFLLVSLSHLVNRTLFLNKCAVWTQLCFSFMLSLLHLCVSEGGGLGGGAGLCDWTERKTHQGENTGYKPGIRSLLIKSTLKKIHIIYNKVYQQWSGLGGFNNMGKLWLRLYLPLLFRRKTLSRTWPASLWPMTSARATGRWSATGSSGCWGKPSTASVLWAPP